MSEYYMGQELSQPELPANSPRPAETPPEGVIVTDITPDGWTRRYLYKNYMGEAEELLIREIPPARISGEASVIEEAARMSGEAMVIEEPVYAAPPQPVYAPVAMQAPPPMQVPVPMQGAAPMPATGSPFAPQSMMRTVPMRGMNVSVPQMAPALAGSGVVQATPHPDVQRAIPNVQPMAAPAAPQTLMLRNTSEPLRLATAALGMSRGPTPTVPMGGGPTTPMQKQLALQTDATPRIGPAGLGASQRARIAAPASNSRSLVPRLGQVQTLGQAAPPAPPAPPVEAPPAPLEPVATKCPGPVEMTDGHIIEPEDYINLKDLCELVPFLTEAALQAKLKQMAGKQGLAPGQPLSLVGQAPSGMSTFGPGSPFAGPGGGGGGGGGGFGGFGGGGGPGPAGPPGPAGTAGPPGPPGPGTATDFLVKTDGDFTVGPGGFVPVPGTLLAFNTPTDGAAIFLLQAVLGCNNSQNAVLGLRIDGTDFPLNPRLLHTFVGGVGEFFIPAHASFPMTLVAGAHTVEVILRGISAGEFCSAAGLGFPATVSANPGTPLALTVLHQGPAAPPASAAVLVVDGVNKMDGNFTSASVVPVPGTLLNFNVTSPGNAYFAISGSLDAVAVASITNAILGIRIDGVDYSLAQTSEQQGAGDDKMFVMHLAGSLVLPMTVGAHQAQLLFGNVGGVNQFALHASADHPATISVIHP